MYSQQKNSFKEQRSWQTPGFSQTPEHPVVGISWDDAKIFCEWLTAKERSEGALTAAQFYRLPTDREWSEAVGLPMESGATPEDRSGKVKGIYPWGKTWPPPADAGNFAGSEVKPGMPDNFPFIPNYRDDFARTAPAPAGPTSFAHLGGNVWEWCDDLFNKTSGWRTLRGGSWATSRPEEALSSFRRGLPSSFRYDDVGFRCVIATGEGAH
jgi:formylglycine-generating enzyme required for sulfatase activity